MIAARPCVLLLAGLLLTAIPFQRSLALPLQERAIPNVATDISGMYTFLREGEFVQLTVDDGKLSGYVSRFGDSESDRGVFIDQFFDKTTLDGDRLGFNTKTVHGVWYEFTGVITTNPSKHPVDEAYRVIKGTLIQHTTDAKGAEKVMQRQVEFKSFPADLGKP